MPGNTVKSLRDRTVPITGQTELPALQVTPGVLSLSPLGSSCFCDPLILAGDMGLELLATAIHREKDLNDRPRALVVDRLRLGALHRYGFDGARLCPLGN